MGNDHPRSYNWLFSCNRFILGKQSSDKKSRKDKEKDHENTKMSKRNIELQKEFNSYKDWAEKIIKGLVKQIELKNKEIGKLEMMMDR